MASLIIMDYGQKQWSEVLMMDLLLINTQLFSSEDITVDAWIRLKFFFFSCLDSHSDGTHSLQRIQVMLILNLSKSVLMKKQAHLHLGWPENEYILSKFSIFLGEQFSKTYFHSLSHPLSMHH